MTARIYLSSAAKDAVRQAQTVLDEHTPVGLGEQCAACGAAGPCAQRRAAIRLLGRYQQLPHRKPGATRPDLIVPRAGSTGRSWFTARS